MGRLKNDGMEIYKRIEYNKNNRKKESYKKLVENIYDLRMNGIR